MHVRCVYFSTVEPLFRRMGLLCVGFSSALHHFAHDYIQTTADCEEDTTQELQRELSVSLEQAAYRKDQVEFSGRHLTCTSSNETVRG